MNWLKQSSLDFPSEIKPPPNATQVAFKPFAQFGYAGSNSSDRVNYVTPRVPCLSHPVRPANVERLVANRILNTLQRPSLFTFANVGKEILELQPSFADTYSTLNVVLGILMPSIASVYHVAPHTVDSRFRTTVSGSNFRCSFSTKTATGFCVARHEMAICNNHLCSTVAQANTLTGTSIGISNYKKSCESLVNEVYFGRHNVRLSISNVLFSNRHWL